MPKPTPPADIAKQEPSSVLPYKRGGDWLFHRKIAEVKGKIQQRHSGDTLFIPISKRLASLDANHGNLERRDQRVINYATISGATVAAVPAVVITAKALTTENGIRYVLSLVAMPFLVAMGGGIGWICGASAYDYKMASSLDNELISLVTEYNRLNTISHVIQPNDTIR